MQVNSLLVEQKKLQGKVKNLESQLLLDKRITQAKEDCNQIRRASVMVMGSLTSQRLGADIRSPSLNHKPLSGSNSLRPISPGSALESDIFFNGTNNNKIENGTEVTDKRTDSRSVKSRTCIVM